MITHMVLLKVKQGVPQKEIDLVFAEIAALQLKIAGIVHYAGGAYSSPEGMNQGYTHGFCMTFKDAASRNAYLPHPLHEPVKAHVVKILDGGLKGVVAFDFEC